MLELVAAAHRLHELDRIEERHEVLLADRDIPIASGTVGKGTISGMRFEIVGIVDGEEMLVVEHVTRLRDDDAPHWPQGQGYRIRIEGEPNVDIELELSSDRRRPQPRGLPRHRDARPQRHPVGRARPPPASLTMLDLPVYSATVAARPRA